MPDADDYPELHFNTSSDFSTESIQSIRYEVESLSRNIDQYELGAGQMKNTRPEDTAESLVVEQAFESLTTNHVVELLVEASFDVLVDALFDQAARSVLDHIEHDGYSVSDSIFETCGSWNRELAGWFCTHIENDRNDIDVPDDLITYFRNRINGISDPRSDDVYYEPETRPQLDARSLRAFYIADAMGVVITPDQAEQIGDVDIFLRRVGNGVSPNDAIRQATFGESLRPETLDIVADPDEWPDRMDPTNIEQRTCDVCGTAFRRIYTAEGEEVFVYDGETVDHVQHPDNIDNIIPRRHMRYICSECVERVTREERSADIYTIITGGEAVCIYVNSALLYSESGFGEIGEDEVNQLLQDLNHLTQIEPNGRLPSDMFTANPDIGIPTHEATVVLKRRSSPVEEPTDMVHVDSDDFNSVQVAKHIIHSGEDITINV